MRDGKHVILFVDDDADIRDSLRIILEANGYAMEEAESAERGLQVYRETQPDLVIVDLMMEEVDAGTSFVRDLKLLGNEAPIYLLSSTGDAFSQVTSFAERGLAGVFQKPIKSDVLLSLLREKLQ